MSFISPAQLDTSKPGTWPIYYQVILWVIIFVAIFFLYNRFLREDLLAEQESNRQQIIQLESEYKRLYQFHKDLPLYEAKKKELVRNLLSLLEFLPIETEMPSLIDQIYNAAYKSNINFNQLTPQGSVRTAYYNIEPISLNTATGFNNIVSFIEYIGQLPRILNVRSFELNVNQSTLESLNISSNLETYIYNQDISKYTGNGDGNE